MSFDPQQVESVFRAALALPVEERTAYLERSCGEDAELRRHVEKLLHAHQQAGDLLQQAALPGTTSAYTPDRATYLLDQPGSRLGPYKLLQKLGEGGMGAVWMAEQTEPVQRRVALKVIKTGLDSAHVLARFESERQALALMEHPNIARVLDAGSIAGEPGGVRRPYFVMELVKGIPITKFCDQEQLSPRERLKLFVSVCQAVQHAHQKGIIHRDLKPSNVLIALYDGKPVPKVIDFGVAKATSQKLTEHTLFTEVGQIVGTLEYMSPEQAELNNLDIDTRADIYSLGVLLYELLTGSPPFTARQLRGAAFTEMLRIIREVEPAKPSTKMSGSEELPAIAAKRKLEPKRLTKLVQGELDWITMKCLEKERSRRYETANGLAMDVQRYLECEPVLAGPPSVSYRLRKYVRRHRGAVLAAGLVLLALVAGMAGTTLGLLRANAARLAEAEQRQFAEQERDAKEQARKEAEANAAEAKHQEKLARGRKRQAEQNAQEANHQKELAQEQKRQTDKQAAIARAVNRFLRKDLLGQADVGQQMVDAAPQRDPDVKARTLLDRAAKTIEGKFKDQPRTEAEIRSTIGLTYQALGRYEEARSQLERSVQLWMAQLGADDLNTLASKSNLATLYVDQGKYERSEPLYKEVLQGFAAKLEPNHPVLLTGKSNLAGLYRRQGKFDLAEPIYNEVVQGFTSKLGADHPSTLSSKNSLAELYSLQGKYDRAETLYKEVLRGRAAKLGADHPDTLTSKNNLATLYLVQHKYDRAESLYREVVQMRTAQLGVDHDSTLTSKNNLAELFRVQRKYDRAAPLFEEVLQGFTTKLGSDHPSTLTAKNNLASLYLVQGKYDRAEPLYKEVLQGFTAKLGADHPSTLTSRSNLAALYWRMGKLKESIPLFEEVLRAQRAKLGTDHPDTLHTMANLGVNYRDAGRTKLAIALLEETLQRAGKRPGGILPKLAWVPAALAQSYDNAERYAKVEPLYRTFLDQTRNQLGAAHPTTAARMAPLGLNLLRQQKYAEAEPILRECLAIRAKEQPDLWTTFGTQSMLGEALAGQKKYAAAEPLLLKGYAGMKEQEKTIPLQGKIRLLESVERLVQLYDAWGKKDKADDWRTKLAAARKALPSTVKEK